MSCVDAGQPACGGLGIPSALTTSWPGNHIPSASAVMAKVCRRSGSGHSVIACWVGSGPSDPLRHVSPIGNASTGRLAKVVKLAIVGSTRHNRYFCRLPNSIAQGIATIRVARRERAFRQAETERSCRSKATKPLIWQAPPLVVLSSASG